MFVTIGFVSYLTLRYKVSKFISIWNFSLAAGQYVLTLTHQKTLFQSYRLLFSCCSAAQVYSFCPPNRIESGGVRTKS